MVKSHQELDQIIVLFDEYIIEVSDFVNPEKHDARVVAISHIFTEYLICRQCGKRRHLLLGMKRTQVVQVASDDHI